MIDLYEVVIKLNGPIRPVGEPFADEVRLSNLKQLCFLVNRLVKDIDCVSSDKGQEESVLTAKRFADHFLAVTLGIQE